jgi:hypothetical protein
MHILPYLAQKGSLCDKGATPYVKIIAGNFQQASHPKTAAERAKIGRQKYPPSKTKSYIYRPPKLPTKKPFVKQNFPTSELKTAAQIFDCQNFQQARHTRPPNSRQNYPNSKLILGQSFPQTSQNLPPKFSTRRAPNQYKHVPRHCATTPLEKPCVANPPTTAAINHLKSPTKCHPHA